jgi:putative peptidoglycan binding protein
MRRSLLICIGSVALALTAGAQIPYYQTHRKTAQTTTTDSGYRSTSAVRHPMPPQRTFSTARVRQPAFSTARFREPTLGTTRIQPHMNSSFMHRPTMTNTAISRRTLPPVTNDLRESRVTPRPRPSDSFVNRSLVRDAAVRREPRLATANDLRESRLTPRSRPTNSFVNRSLERNPVARPAPRQPFNRNWADSNFRESSGSFVNRSRTTSFWSGTRAAVTNNWRGSEFSGRQYWAFRNYQRQWHDSGWWNDHCGDRIVFVTVFSQPFPFFFDAGYWYPAWGYYPDSYYPYDGPVYGYNDLPPDEVIANVQTQLYNEGYYDGPIDGILGPDTRAAIADYQADHGLAVTAAIDEPTVESLGLV